MKTSQILFMIVLLTVSTFKTAPVRADGLGVGRAEVQVVLVESTDLGPRYQRLNFPLLISDGRGLRLLCKTRIDEENVIHGLGFIALPSEVLDPLNELVVRSAPLEQPLLCPNDDSGYRIKLYRAASNDGSGDRYYLQFPRSFEDKTYDDKLFVPGCAELVSALNLKTEEAINADPAPFFQGKIFNIGCLRGTPVASPVPVRPSRPLSQFFSWCLKTDLDAEQLRTVKALLTYALGSADGMGNEGKCAEANTFLQELTAINLVGTNLSNLEPLISLKNIDQLALANNNIEDITPLAALKGLAILDLSGNKIKNISALSGSLRLKQLNLKGNKLQDIRPLSSLTNLNRLNLAESNLSDDAMSIFPFLGHLTEVNLSGNRITDPTALTGLRDLAKLDLSFNQISSLDVTVGFNRDVVVKWVGNPFLKVQEAKEHRKKIEELLLELSQAGIAFGKDWAFNAKAMMDFKWELRKRAADYDWAAAERALHSMENEVDVLMEKFKDLLTTEELESFSKFQILWRNNLVGRIRAEGLILYEYCKEPEKSLALEHLFQILRESINDANADCNVLERELVKLQELSLVKIRRDIDFTPLKSLYRGEIRQLRRITIRQEFDTSATGPMDLTPLTALRQLTHLTVENGHLEKLGVIAEMTNLEVLNLNYNQVTDISPLKSLTGVKEIYLNGNSLTQLQDLRSLNKLEQLEVAQNEITSLEGLEELKSLKRLKAGGNKISDLAPLQGLVRLEELSIHSNRITNLRPLGGLVNLSNLVIDHNRVPPQKFWCPIEVPSRAVVNYCTKYISGQ